MKGHPVPKDLLALSLDELLERLGEDLGVPLAPRDGHHPSAAELRQRARDWVARRWTNLREKVCGNLTIQALRSDNSLLVVELATLIAANRWLPEVQASYAAAIVLKIGLDRLCAGQDPFASGAR